MRQGRGLLLIQEPGEMDRDYVIGTTLPSRSKRRPSRNVELSLLAVEEG